MKKLTRESLQLMTRAITDELSRHDTVRFLRDRESVRQSILYTVADEIKHEDERIRVVRARIEALSDAPPEGSREFEELYRRFLDEERGKSGFDAN
jgi:hypothetical protein